MHKEEESDSLQSQSRKGQPTETDLSLGDKLKDQIATNSSQKQKVRHVYIQEENSLGRFVPFLLLKDRLHSQIDTNGNSALIHMCSYNSPYLPLYLKTLRQNDPLLNRQNNLHHTCLDVAGLYCRSSYIQLLKDKGAIDQGRVDQWAIQGGVIENWSGEAPLDKKHLIHCAAYNDLPEVLNQFRIKGANLHENDANNLTPIDVATLNHSYKALIFFADLGFRPKKQILNQTASPFIHNLFKKQGKNVRIFKRYFTHFYVILCFILCFLSSPIALSQQEKRQISTTTIAGIMCVISLVLSYVIKWSKVESEGDRKTGFYSSLLDREINYNSHYTTYLIWLVSLVILGVYTQVKLEVDESILMGATGIVILICLLAWSAIVIVLLYGILTNTTYHELTLPHEHPQFWTYVEYIPMRNILRRQYNNKHNKRWRDNLSYYWNYKL